MHSHQHPESYRDAVAQLQEQREAIRAAFASGNPEAAHDALHEVGELLEDLPALAVHSDLGEDARKQVVAAVDVLFDAYTQLDESLHGGAKVEYSQVSDQIDQHVATLVSHLEAAGEGHVHSHDGDLDHAHDEDHDHDHDLGQDPEDPMN